MEEKEVGTYVDILRKHGVNTQANSWSQLTAMAKAMKEHGDNMVSDGWTAFDFEKPETRPIKSGKYFIQRKDGKVHWETWNGGGWAYNHSSITFWKEVLPRNTDKVKQTVPEPAMDHEYKGRLEVACIYDIDVVILPRGVSSEKVAFDAKHVTSHIRSLLRERAALAKEILSGNGKESEAKSLFEKHSLEIKKYLGLQ